MKKTALLLAILLAAVMAPGSVFAQQETAEPQQAAPAEEDYYEERAEDEETLTMMGMHAKMVARMQKMNRELDQKVEAMQAATGQQEQIQAMQAVIMELISQRKEMMGKMMGMHGRMCKMMAGKSGKGMMGKDGMGMQEDDATIKMKTGKGKSMIVIIQE